MTGQQCDEAPTGAIPLSEATQRFLPTEIWEGMNTTQYLPRRSNPNRSKLNRVRMNVNAAMVNMLRAGELVGYAQEHPLGPFKEIPRASWRNLHIVEPAKGVVADGEIRLTNVHVLCAKDLENEFPTGMPGRPSQGKDPILRELERRIAKDETEETLAEQARVLRSWYRTEYPRSKLSGTRSIENLLRHTFNSARIKRRNSDKVAR